jgi:hypothetical protein
VYVSYRLYCNHWEISGVRLVAFRLEVNLKDTLIRETEKEGECTWKY